MTYRWLKFWGDLREGMHSSWQEALNAAHDHRTLAKYHLQSAGNVRTRMGVAHRWDLACTPSRCSWVMLAPKEFEMWCQSVGLLTLGDHLKRVLSVRAADRLRISLDRRKLVSILQFINDRQPESYAPLPLHIPTADELGLRALATACSRETPALWSRLRLRFDKELLQDIEIRAQGLVHVPTLEELSFLDESLFESTEQIRLNAANHEASPKWTQTPTLSA